MNACRLSSSRWGLRNFSQDVEKSVQSLPKGSVTPLPPLSEAMPNLPPVSYSTAKSDDGLTEVTVLSNGLRVASEKKFGQFCTAGGENTFKYTMNNTFYINKVLFKAEVCHNYLCFSCY